MNAKVLLVLTAMFFPVVSLVFSFGEQQFLTVVYLSLIPLWLLSFSGTITNRDLLDDVRSLRYYNYGFILLCILQLAVFINDMRGTLSLIPSNILSLLLIHRFSKERHEVGIELLQRIFIVLGFVFVAQFVLSAYESMRGEYFGAAMTTGDEYSIQGLDFQRRLVFSLFTQDLGILGDLKLPFSGLVGQHNYWGTQLPFYNLLFLYQYHVTGKRTWLFLNVTIVVAVLLNTTRFAIGAVLITDLFFLVWDIRAKRWARRLLAVAMVIGFAFVWTVRDYLIQAWEAYFELTDTITVRSEIYQRTQDYFWSQDLPSMIVGNGTKRIGALARVLSPDVGSFESLFFQLLMLSGVIGVVLVIILLIAGLKDSSRLSNIDKLTLRLLVLNMVLVSVTSNLVFAFFVFSIVTLLYLYVMMHHRKSLVAQLDGKLGTA